MKRLLICMACVLVAQPATAQDEAKKRLEDSPRHHEWVKVKAKGDREVKCLVVFPEVKKPATVVIVIHENRGLNDWSRSVTDQVAEAGYVAVAPDLLSETGPKGGGTDAFPSSDAARKGIYKLQQEQITSDLDAVFRYAKKMKAGNGKVAVAGFCWGGGQTFSYAAHNPKLAAAFVFYGSAPKDDAAYKKIEPPVYGFYGGSDFRITGQVPAVAKKLKKLNKKFEPVTYEGAGHGFMRSGEAKDASKANRQARAAAWKRWRKLLSEL